MSWSHGSIVSTKKRISVIEKRTRETAIPPIEVLFSTYVKEGNPKLTKELVEQVYFSSFPAHDASATFSALSMNKQNIDGLRKSGTLGVVVEMLGRLNLESPQLGDHITDLVRAISILTEDDDTRHRLLLHPRAISDLLKLCQHSCGVNQVKIFQVIEKLCSTSEGMNIFLDKGIYSTLLSYELLLRPSTLLFVRHQTAALILKLANHDASLFPVLTLQEILIHEDECLVDGDIEVQLLNSLHAFLNWTQSENIPFPSCPSLMSHLVNQIKAETFVDLEHVSNPLP
jgi:hypothetical protein